MPLRASASAADAGYRADGGFGDDFVVLAASVAGVAHRLNGRRCEDSYAWSQPVAGRLALVVADGVSGAGRGGQGADLAVRAAIDYLAQRARRWGEMECVAAITAASEELTRAGGGVAAELSTTLVVALLSAQEGGGARADLARVGDSTAFTLSEGADWREIFGGPAAGTEHGEVSSTATAVLPFGPTPGPERAPVCTASVELVDGTALVLLSDGVADPLRDGPGTVAPALASVLSAGARGDLPPLALAQAVDFSRRGALDDRTLLVAWARSSTTALAGDAP